MSKIFIQRLIFFMAISAICPFTGFANEGCMIRYDGLSVSYETISDTVPQAKKPEEDVPAKSKPTIIKQVPKSRRQIKPVTLPKVPVAPIKIIKPKTIRRTIGIIG